MPEIISECVFCESKSIISNPAILMPFLADRIFGWKPATINEEWNLRTIRNGNTYSLCKTMYCNSCKGVFSDIRFSNEELAKLYKDYRGNEYTELREFYEPGYKKINSIIDNGNPYIGEIENFLRQYVTEPLSVLDYGGDSGKNTPFKNNLQNQIHIYDISEVEVIDNVRQVTKEEALNNKYDLVVCSNVLEHVSYPSIVIKELKSFLHETSTLYIELPFEDLMRRPYDQKSNCKYHWHEHINFFSVDAIKELLSKNQLTLIYTDVFNTNAGGKNVSLIRVIAKK